MYVCIIISAVRAYTLGVYTRDPIKGCYTDSCTPFCVWQITFWRSRRADADRGYVQWSIYTRYTRLTRTHNILLHGGGGGARDEKITVLLYTIIVVYYYMTFMFSRASAHPRSMAETFFHSRDREPGFTREIEYCINIRTAATEREIPRQIAARYAQHDRIIGTLIRHIITLWVLSNITHFVGYQILNPVASLSLFHFNFEMFKIFSQHYIRVSMLASQLEKSKQWYTYWKKKLIRATQY